MLDPGDGKAQIINTTSSGYHISVNHSLGKVPTSIMGICTTTLNTYGTHTFWGSNSSITGKVTDGHSTNIRQSRYYQITATPTDISIEEGAYGFNGSWIIIVS